MGLEGDLRERRSCRRFNLSPSTLHDIAKRDDLIKKILWAGSRAPYASGGPRRDVIVVSGDLLSGLSEACFGQKYVGECGCAFVVCGNDVGTMLDSGNPKYVFDVAACAMCMDLMAVDMGYGTCWIGHFDEKRVREAAGIRDSLRPTIILLVGARA